MGTIVIRNARRSSSRNPSLRRSFQPRLESLEGRVVPATVFDGGTTTLSIALAANEAFHTVSNGTTYGFSLIGGTTFTNGGVANAGDFSAFGGGDLTLQASGLARYSVINLLDDGTGTSVDFVDSGANSYSDSFTVTLDNSPAVSSVQIRQTTFTGTAGITVNTTNAVELLSGSLTTVSGAISLIGSAAIGSGVYLAGNVTSTTGPVNLMGTTTSTQSGHYGVFVDTGTVISSTGTGAAASSITMKGTSSGGVGVLIYGAGTKVVAVDGDVQITGEGVSQGGVEISGGAVVQSTGTVAGAAKITITGTNSAGGDNADGIRIQEANTKVTSVAGDITITAATAGDDGMQLTGPAVISSTGTGATAAKITISATSTGANGLAEGLTFGGASVLSVDGDISIAGTTNGASGIVTSQATAKATGVGKVSLQGTGGPSGYGVWLNSITTVSSADAPVSVIGKSSSPDVGLDGIAVSADSLVGSTGTGSAATVTLDGSSTGGSRGIRLDNGQATSVGGAISLIGKSAGIDGIGLFGANAKVTSTNAAVSLMGTSSGAGFAYGVQVGESVLISSTGAGSGATVTIDGSQTGGGSGFLVNANAKVASVGGDISLKGTSVNGLGAQIYGGKIEATGADASISIVGTTTSMDYSHVAVFLQQGASVTATGTGAEATVKIDGKATGNGSGTVLQDGIVVTSAGGDITIAGECVQGHGTRLFGAGTQVTSSAASINISGKTASPNYFIWGVLIDAGPLVSATGSGEKVTISGEGGNGSGGALLDSGATVKTADGDLTISGSTFQSNGVDLRGAGTKVQSSGKIQLLGTDRNYGTALVIESGSSVVSTATGPAAPDVLLKGESKASGRGFYSSGVITVADADLHIQGLSVNGAGVEVAGGTISSTGTGADAGTISVDGQSGNYYVGLNLGGSLTSANGDITLKGQSNIGDAAYLFGAISSTGLGQIKLDATSASGYTGATTYNANVTSVAGDISVTAQGRFYGIILGSSTIESTGTAKVTILGTANESSKFGGGVYAYTSKAASAGGNLTITGVGGVLMEGGGQVTATGAATVEITANSPILLRDTVISADASVTLVATDTAVITAENFSLLDGSKVESKGGAVTIQAGDNVMLDATSTVSASGAVLIQGDAGDADPGSGTRIDVLGAVSGSTVTVRGGADADGFKIAPSLTTGIHVIGGDPAAPVAFGDGIAIASPVGETSTLNPTGTGAGFFTTTGGYQNVTFVEIETTGPLSLVVTTKDDVIDANDGKLSLREAAMMANLNPSADSITFDAALNGQTVLVDQGPIVLSDGGADGKTTITGPGANLLTISGGEANRLFTLLSGAHAEIAKLTLTKGFAKDDYGGAIYSKGTLTIAQSKFTLNKAEGYGGAIYSDGTLTITQSSYVNNESLNGYGGGAVYSRGELSISQTEFTANMALDYGSGGAIYISDGSATIDQSFFTSNAGGYGGAIENDNELTLTNSTFVSNHATSIGGAIAQYGTLMTVSRCTFSANQSDAESGAVANYGEMTVTESTFSGNTAGTDGGAIVNYDRLTTTNTTFSGNSAAGSGGAILNYYRVTLTNSTVTANRADSDDVDGGEGGAIYHDGDFTQLENSIVAGNFRGSGTTADDILGAVDATFSLIGSDSGATISGSDNVVNVEALLSALADFGGPVRTHALLPGSPAINAGTGTDADVRGIGPVGQRDIGAFESRGFAISKVSGDGQTTSPGQAFSNPLVVQVVANHASEPVAGGKVAFRGPASGAGIAPNPAAASIGADGKASATVTANATSGAYAVVAEAAGVAAPTSFSLTNGAPLPGGSITSFQIDSGTAQRSVVRSLKLTFASAITPAQVAEVLSKLSLTKVGGGAVGLTGTLDGSGTMLTVKFTGSSMVGGSLADGRYSLKYGGTEVISPTQLFRLFGDANGNGTVDASDRAILNAIANGARRGFSPLYNEAFDYNNNGIISTDDRDQFNLRFGTSI